METEIFSNQNHCSCCKCRNNQNCNKFMLFIILALMCAGEREPESCTRTVTGRVSSVIAENVNLVDIAVELRTTFLTPASSQLSTFVVFNGFGEGTFTLYDVPCGEYVLWIKRPGYLTRAMRVRISQNDPDVVQLIPPDARRAVGPSMAFTLWPGDVNDDGVIDNIDFELMHNIVIGATAPPSDIRNFDLNADGRIDQADHSILHQHLGLTVRDYPGAETVDFTRRVSVSGSQRNRLPR